MVPDHSGIDIVANQLGGIKERIEERTDKKRTEGERVEMGSGRDGVREGKERHELLGHNSHVDVGGWE